MKCQEEGEIRSSLLILDLKGGKGFGKGGGRQDVPKRGFFLIILGFIDNHHHNI